MFPGNNKLIGDKLSDPTHLTVGQLVPGLFAVGEDLPEDNTEAPDVALRGELPVHDALRGHPADRQHRTSAHLRRERRRGNVCNVSSLLHNGSLKVNMFVDGISSFSNRLFLSKSQIDSCSALNNL